MRMVSIAIKNLFQEKTRLGVGSSGVAFGVVLVVIIVGVYNAMNVMVTNSVTSANADLWVGSEGSVGSMHVQSNLSMDLADNIRLIEGVQEVRGLIRTPIAIEMNDDRYLLYVQGYDTESDMGGPWEISEGVSRPSQGEIIIDSVFARKNSLGIGDNIEILGHEFEITGISDETSLLIAYMVFVPLEDAVALMPENTVNYFLITTNVLPGQVATKIEENISGVSVLPSEKVADLAKGEILGGFLPILFVIVGVGLLVGVVMVGLTIYTLTVERSQEYGVLKAIGAGNRHLYMIVAKQALLLSALGFLLGGLLSGIVIYFAGMFVPEFIITVTVPILGWIFLLFLFMGLVASYIPARKVAKVDPATVFRA